MMISFISNENLSLTRIRSLRVIDFELYGLAVWDSGVEW